MTRRGQELSTGVIPAARVPALAVRLAARAVPAGPLRDRYRQEFLAELFGLTRSRQTRHALGVLSRAWALRTALLDQQHTREVTMTTPRRPVLCRLNLHHTWRTRRTEDGVRYRQCAKCGKDSARGARGPGDWGAGIGA